MKKTQLRNFSSKVSIVLLSFALLFAFSPLQGDVTAKEKGSLSVSSVYEDSNRKTLSITIQASSIEEFYGGEFELQYNPSVGYVREASVGKGLSSALTALNTESAQDGSVKFVWASPDQLDSDSTVLNLEFYTTHDQGLKATDLKLVNANVYNQYGEIIDISLEDGFVKPFDGVEKESREVSTTKEWTVTLNTEMSQSSVNSQNVYIVNERQGTRHPAEVTLSADGKQITVAPSEAYGQYDRFSLVVSEQVRSVQGIQLKEAVKLPFTIK